MATKFNPEKKEQLTMGETLGTAMKITNPEDAEQYLIAYVAYIQKYLDEEPREDDKTAMQIAKENLGYYAGYYDNETRQRVERLFNCAHLFFGKATSIPITPDEAFQLGKERGEGT